MDILQTHISLQRLLFESVLPLAGEHAERKRNRVRGKTARNWFLQKKKMDPSIIDYVYFGITIAQHHVFYGHTWGTAILTDDKKHVPALLIHQACSTSTTALQLASLAIDHGSLNVAFGLMTDRCSNGAHTVWAQPLGPEESGE